MVRRKWLFRALFSAIALIAVVVLVSACGKTSNTRGSAGGGSGQAEQHRQRGQAEGGGQPHLPDPGVPRRLGVEHELVLQLRGQPVA